MMACAFARHDGSFFVTTSECLKNTWGYYIQSQHVAQSEFNVPLRVGARELPGILYAFPIALSVLAILQCLGFCHYRSDMLFLVVRVSLLHFLHYEFAWLG